MAPASSGDHLRRHQGSSSSALFAAVSSLGVVCNAVPPAVWTGRNDAFICASTGHNFQVYNAHSLRVVLKGVHFKAAIRAIAGTPHRIFVATAREITVWNRLECVGTCCSDGAKSPDSGHSSDILGLLLLGDTTLLSWSSREIRLWDQTTFEHVDTVELPGKTLGGGGTGAELIVHSPVHVNKILVGTSQGEVLLVNVRKLTIIHTMAATTKGSTTHKLSDRHAVTCLALSRRHLDVLAVGFAGGGIAVVDFKRDELLMRLEGGLDRGGITSLLFHEGDDPSEEKAVLLSGHKNGDILIWSLKKRCLLFSHLAVHASAQSSLDSSLEVPLPSGVTRIGRLPDENVIFTSGADNCLILWVFDGSDGNMREWKSRRGHPAGIRNMRMYDTEMGFDLLTAAAYSNGGSHFGTLGCTSTIQQQQNTIYSQKSIRSLKQWYNGRLLPPVVDISFATSRHWDWPALVTTHAGMHHCPVWSPHTRQLAPSVVQLPARGMTRRPDATACAVSGCGNFVVVGYQNGELHLFTLQSQKHRGPFQSESDHRHAIASQPSKPGEEGPEEQELITASTLQRRRKLLAMKTGSSADTPPPDQPVFDGPVIAVHIHNSSAVIAASGGSPHVALWDLRSRKFHSTLDLTPLLPPLGEGRVWQLQRLAFLGMIMAVVVQEKEENGQPRRHVAVIDLQSRVLVRDFGTVDGSVTDLTFSPDGHWLVVAHTDYFEVAPNNPQEEPSVHSSSRRQESAAGESAGYLAVFDLLSAARVDWIKVDAPIHAVEFDPSMAFLYTAQSPLLASESQEEIERTPPGNVSLEMFLCNAFGSVHVWSNKCFFSLFDATTAGASVSAPIPVLQRDEVVDFVEDDGPAEGKGLGGHPGGAVDTCLRNHQLEEGALTLSGLAAGRLRALLHLDDMKERSAPSQPVKKVDSVPFFIPTMFEGSSSKFAKLNEVPNTLAETNDSPLNAEWVTATNFKDILPESDKTRIRGKNVWKERDNVFTTEADRRSNLQILLDDLAAIHSKHVKYQQSSKKSSKKQESRLQAISQQFAAKIDEITIYFLSLSPSGVHLAMYALDDSIESERELDSNLYAMLLYFRQLLATREKADYIQTLLSIFLKVHGERIRGCIQERVALRELATCIETMTTSDWSVLDANINKMQCFFKYLSWVQME